MEINFLTTNDVTIIHFIIMKRYGEGEQAGIKEGGLLESAIHRPQQSAFGEDAYPSLLEKSGALFESLARNHCFFNGNKRTAFAALDIFLKKNGYKLKQNDKANEDFTLVVAQGKVDLLYIFEWLEENIEKR